MKRGIESSRNNENKGTAAKLNSENQNNAATLQIAEIPEKYRRSPELRKIKKGCRGHKKLLDATGRNYKHRGVSKHDRKRNAAHGTAKR
jgi:hypothetical protein